MNNFCGLYYPGESWDLDVEDSMLKKCMLFFDRIYAIVPEVFSVDWKTVQPYEELDPFLANVRHAKEEDRLSAKEAIGGRRFSSEQEETYLAEMERHGRIERFLDKVALLRKEGVLKLVDPRENILDPPYWGPDSGPYPWAEIGHHYERLLEQGLLISELDVHKPHVLYGSILADLRDKEFRATAASLGSKRVVLYKGQAEQNWLQLLGRSSGFQEDEWQPLPTIGVFCGSFVGTVSTAIWAAFVTNHTLLTAHKHNLIPVTPTNTFRDLLQCKVRHLRDLVEAEQLKHSYVDHPEFKAGFSGFSLAILTLPNLEAMSFEDVLELRLALEEELTAFREQMTLLSERIRTGPWESSFISEIQHIAEHSVQPVVRKLQRKLETSRKEVILRAFKNIISAPTVLSVLGTIWAGLPPLLVMAVAASLVSVETALEYHFERTKILQSNGLSLLLRLPKNSNIT